jgi:hypothetical protein
MGSPGQVMTALPRWNACIRLIKAWHLSARVEKHAVVTSEYGAYNVEGLIVVKRVKILGKLQQGSNVCGVRGEWYRRKPSKIVAV